MTKTRKLTECAILIAIAFILSFIKVYELPNGGSITLCSMLPIIIISHRSGLKWGVLSGFVYSFLQLMQGFYPPPVPTLAFFTLSILLDYVVAFTILGTAVVFAKPFENNKRLGFLVSIICVGTIRAISHIVAGTLIWQSLWGASAVYNLSYMIPETIVTAIVGFLMYKQIQNVK
ncbi:MAG: energy-coupled thiamine transporter ThiT [Clostridia bacterium]